MKSFYIVFFDGFENNSTTVCVEDNQNKTDAIEQFDSSSAFSKDDILSIHQVLFTKESLMSSLTPWSDARKQHSELDALIFKRNYLASLDRDLSTIENNELSSLNESIDVWANRLNLQ